MTFIRDLIHIPERVHQGDFVLKLSEGVTHAEATLRDYVVTPQLVDAFDNALGFIKQSVESGGSKAAYLHGSFGSGKSHFMAVLNLLLAGHTQARSTPELASVVARHDWTHGKKFLLVPYHMIGAKDMESAILGQYAEYVRKLHRQAPVPGFYLAQGLFDDARRMREQMGDSAFFAKLNEGSGGTGSGWGDMDAGWDAASFDAATMEAPNGEERARLVGDLIGKFFSAYRSLAGDGESFVSLDDGLSIMTRHAQALGYDAVILFLDELVLWLAMLRTSALSAVKAPSWSSWSRPPTPTARFRWSALSPGSAICAIWWATTWLARCRRSSAMCCAIGRRAFTASRWMTATCPRLPKSALCARSTKRRAKS